MTDRLVYFGEVAVGGGSEADSTAHRVLVPALAVHLAGLRLKLSHHPLLRPWLLRDRLHEFTDPSPSRTTPLLIILAPASPSSPLEQVDISTKWPRRNTHDIEGADINHNDSSLSHLCRDGSERRVFEDAWLSLGRPA